MSTSLTYKEWQAVVKVVEEFQPQTVYVARFNRFKTRYFGVSRYVEKDHVLTMKKGDEEAEVIHEWVEDKGKVIESAILVQVTHHTKTPVCVTETRT